GLSRRHDGHAKLMGNRRQDKPVAGFIVPGCDALQHMLMSLIGFGKASGLHLLALLRAVSLVLGFPFTRWWEEAINGSTVLDLFVDPLVLLFLFEGLVNNFDEHLRRNDYDSVVITDDDVAGLYGGATASDGAVHFPRDVTTTQHCRVVAVGIDRNVYVQHSSGVTDATVGNDRVRAADFGAHFQDVTDGFGVFFATCFHYVVVVLLDRVHILLLLYGPSHDYHII